MRRQPALKFQKFGYLRQTAAAARADRLNRIHAAAARVCSNVVKPETENQLQTPKAK